MAEVLRQRGRTPAKMTASHFPTGHILQTLHPGSSWYCPAGQGWGSMLPVGHVCPGGQRASRKTNGRAVSFWGISPSSFQQSLRPHLLVLSTWAWLSRQAAVTSTVPRKKAVPAPVQPGGAGANPGAPMDRAMGEHHRALQGSLSLRTECVSPNMVSGVLLP